MNISQIPSMLGQYVRTGGGCAPGDKNKAAYTGGRRKT